MGFREELNEIKDKCKKECEEIDKLKEWQPFDDTRSIEQKKILRKYLKEAQELREKYNIRP